MCKLSFPLSFFAYSLTLNKDSYASHAFVKHILCVFANSSALQKRRKAAETTFFSLASFPCLAVFHQDDVLTSCEPVVQLEHTKPTRSRPLHVFRLRRTCIERICVPIRLPFRASFPVLLRFRFGSCFERSVLELQFPSHKEGRGKREDWPEEDDVTLQF